MFRRLCVSLILIWSSLASAQDCKLTLKGKVLDRATEKALSFTFVHIEETSDQAVVDSLGNFTIKNLCPGHIHINFSHLSCAPERTYIDLKSDTSLTFYLEHHAELLDEVVVHEHRSGSNVNVSNTINQKQISSEAYKNLADITKKIPGVSSLRNGNTSAKPIVHGLFGNRLTILNNGVAQSGQQWGNDHAPEIDAFMADHISVVKGAAALAYMGSNLGSVMLVDARPVRNDPHLLGTINYIYNTNGRGHTLNTAFEKNSKAFAWRFNGSLKHAGDQRAPDYFLRNTGRREQNLSFQIESNNDSDWHHQLYISSFNARMGVLRGSHISNLTDLESAFTRDTPFFTENTFSDSISAPSQKVHHHLLKAESSYSINENSFLKFTYGGQWNRRDEFDVRRGGRSDRAALSLQQFSHFGEIKWSGLVSDWSVNTGLQYQWIDNANLAGTGVLPLIPNYLSYNPGAFIVFQKSKNNWKYELGSRFDFKAYDVKAISSSLPREIEEFRNRFFNYAFSAGLSNEISDKLRLSINAGSTMRAPHVNELYAMGLHQGVSGIEEGDASLKQETGYKILGNLDWRSNNKLFIQALIYYQYVENYIFLQPEDVFRLTIRGAFPVFTYRQTNASLAGGDLLVSYQPTKNLKGIMKYALIRARDLSNELGLVNIPADNLLLELEYGFAKMGVFENSFIKLGGEYVFRQSRISEEQDFLAPPDPYFIAQFRIGTHLQWSDRKLELNLFVDNLFNTRYRDYLNRLRYFADEPGINFGLRLNYQWES